MSRTWRILAFLTRHRAINRLVNRGLVRAWLSKVVWDELAATPGFAERMRQAEADIAAGRWYSFDTVTGQTTRNPDWPA